MLSARRDPARKFGSGVVGVEVGLHPEYKVRCFMLRRADSTLVDVSYRKCINNLLTSNWVNEVPHILNLRNLSGELLKNNAAKQQVRGTWLTRAAMGRMRWFAGNGCHSRQLL